MGDKELNRLELYCHHGVFVKEIKPCTQDIDFHHNLGSLSVVEYNTEVGKYIEWHQCNVSIESDDQEWAIVQNVNNHTEGSQDIKMKDTKKPVIQMKLKDLNSLEISKNSQKLTLVDSKTRITFYFQHGNAQYILNFLTELLKSSIYQKSSNFYVINPTEAQVTEKSFADLNLFNSETTKSDYKWNFMKKLNENPYEATMDTFCKVTNALLYRPQYQSDEEVAELLNQSLTTDDASDIHVRISSEDYELISKSNSLPPRTLPPRCSPLNAEKWANAFDQTGRIVDSDFVKEEVFRGGVEPDSGLRKEVWKYLLGYYPWNSTTEEREDLRKQKSAEYFIMKQQWKSLSSSQIERFSAYKERKSLIEKDVHRTDRNMEFFAGDDNPNLCVLQEILMTYVMYNFDLGYVQGMSDLLSPLLVELNNEVDAFWCFVGFMNRVSRNFELDQEGMKEQFQQLYCLLCSVEPELASYLDNHDSKNMSFCFRWLLVWFKREFSYQNIFLLWEVLWTEFACKNYHLLLCAAILENEKETLMSNNFGFTEILKHINELANGINAELILRKAEGIFIQISNSVNIPSSVKEILGLTSESGSTVIDNEVSTPRKEVHIRKNEFNNDAQSFFESKGELAFEQSLSMQYL